MSIYDYEQAFEASDKTTTAMRRAIERWFSMYYNTANDTDGDSSQRIPYGVVNKLVITAFSEYKVTANTDFTAKLLQELDKKKRNAMQMAMVGGTCYIKPYPTGKGFSFTLVPRNHHCQVW